MGYTMIKLFLLYERIYSTGVDILGPKSIPVYIDPGSNESIKKYVPLFILEYGLDSLNIQIITEYTSSFQLIQHLKYM